MKTPRKGNNRGSLALSPSGQLHTWGFQTGRVGVGSKLLFPHRVLVDHLTTVVYNCPHTATVALFTKAYKQQLTLRVWAIKAWLSVNTFNIGLLVLLTAHPCFFTVLKCHVDGTKREQVFHLWIYLYISFWIIQLIVVYKTCCLFLPKQTRDIQFTMK